MKRILAISCLAGLFTTCQIEEEGVPTPDEGFIRFFGDLTSYNASDLEAVGDTLVVFGSQINVQSGNSDFTIIRMNAEGLYLDSALYTPELKVKIDTDGDGFGDTELGTDEDGNIVSKGSVLAEQFEAIQLQGNASGSQIEPIRTGTFADGFLTAGTYLFNDNALGIANVNAAYLGVYDMQLNAVTDTILLFNENPANGLDYFGNDVIQTADGAFIFGGTIEVNRGGVTDLDFRLIKFELSTDRLTTVWEQTLGIEGNGQDDILSRIFEKENGNIVAIGTTFDKSTCGENNGDNGTNVAFYELTAAGNELNSVTYGVGCPSRSTTDAREFAVFNDVVSDAVKVASGFAITGTSTLSSEDNYAFFMNLTNSGNFIAADTLTSGFDPALQTRGLGIVQANDKDYIILGAYEDFHELDASNEEINERAEEALFMKVSQTGIRVHEVHYGSLGGDDSAIDGLLLIDSRIMVVAKMDLGGGVELVSLIKTNDNGELEN
ncbi:MAG: hypothetical protein OXH57_11880 [Ekhidna sp.]|nr:hypothetical protein [Ekhidna sp.]